MGLIHNGRIGVTVEICHVDEFFRDGTLRVIMDGGRGPAIAQLLSSGAFKLRPTKGSQGLLIRNGMSAYFLPSEVVGPDMLGYLLSSPGGSYHLSVSPNGRMSLCKDGSIEIESNGSSVNLTRDGNGNSELKLSSQSILIDSGAVSERSGEVDGQGLYTKQVWSNPSEKGTEEPCYSEYIGQSANLNAIAKEIASGLANGYGIDDILLGSGSLSTDFSENQERSAWDVPVDRTAIRMQDYRNGKVASEELDGNDMPGFAETDMSDALLRRMDGASLRTTAFQSFATDPVSGKIEHYVRINGSSIRKEYLASKYGKIESTTHEGKISGEINGGIDGCFGDKIKLRGTDASRYFAINVAKKIEFDIQKQIIENVKSIKTLHTKFHNDGLSFIISRSTIAHSDTGASVSVYFSAKFEPIEIIPAALRPSGTGGKFLKWAKVRWSSSGEVKEDIEGISKSCSLNIEWGGRENQYMYLANGATNVVMFGDDGSPVTFTKTINSIPGGISLSSIGVDLQQRQQIEDEFYSKIRPDIPMPPALGGYKEAERTSSQVVLNHYVTQTKVNGGTVRGDGILDFSSQVSCVEKNKVGPGWKAGTVGASSAAKNPFSWDWDSWIYRGDSRLYLPSAASVISPTEIRGRIRRSYISSVSAPHLAAELHNIRSATSGLARYLISMMVDPDLECGFWPNWDQREYLAEVAMGGYYDASLHGAYHKTLDYSGSTTRPTPPNDGTSEVVIKESPYASGAMRRTFVTSNIHSLLTLVTPMQGGPTGTKQYQYHVARGVDINSGSHAAHEILLLTAGMYSKGERGKIYMRMAGKWSPDKLLDSGTPFGGFIPNGSFVKSEGYTKDSTDDAYIVPKNVAGSTRDVKMPSLLDPHFGELTSIAYEMERLAAKHGKIIYDPIATFESEYENHKKGASPEYYDESIMNCFPFYWEDKMLPGDPVEMINVMSKLTFASINSGIEDVEFNGIGKEKFQSVSCAGGIMGVVSLITNINDSW